MEDRTADYMDIRQYNITRKGPLLLPTVGILVVAAVAVAVAG
jgi:hypothetical protein